MARRKVQATGGGSFVLTLPKEWVVRHGLDKGSEVEIIQEPDGSLRLAPVGAGERRRWVARVTVDAAGARPEAVLRRVISFYIAGADVIEVVFEGFAPGVVPSLRSLISSRLLGVEIVEESSRSVTFQVVGDMSMDMMQALQRLARTVEYMLEDIAEAIARGEKGMLEEIANRDDIVDKLFIYLSRQAMSIFLGKMLPRDVGVESYADVAVYLVASKNIERIGDHASRIARVLAGEGGVDAALLREMAELYKHSVKLLIKPSVDEAEYMISRIAEAKSRFNAAGVVGESSRRILDYCTDLLELGMNRASMEEMVRRLRAVAKGL